MTDMRALTFDEIRPELLPSVSYASRKLLPMISAVYFALSSNDSVLYVGQTTNLYVRWAAHQRCNLLEQMGCARISYYACKSILLLTIEEAMIQRLQPPLNAPWYTPPQQPNLSPKKPKQQTPQQRYKLTEAAKLVGISPWTLRRMVYAGKVPYIKEDTGHIYIPASWIALKSQPPTKDTP